MTLASGPGISELSNLVGSPARAAGEVRILRADVRPFRPLSPYAPWTWARLRHRDHRKTLCVDGESAVVGGLCISDNWSPSSRGGQGWRDTALQVGGAVVEDVERAFDGMWRDAGIARIKWKDNGFWIDTGFSYELGRWALGDGPRAPELTVEPFVAARMVRQNVILDFKRLDIEDDTEAFNTYVPIIGLRTFWDLTEHWNLHFEGDYGGFGVGDNHQTWHAPGLVGYRWPGWGVHWNLQAGYRAPRVFDFRTYYEAVEDVHGPNVMLSVDF